MTILAGDIKLVESQVMLDTAEGGGAPTSNIIEDATSNSIFPDISETDRAGGRVNLRKVHATVQTLTTDGYYGANIIVAEPPADPNVSVTLFTTNSVFDRRSDAQSRLESYLAYGPPFQGYLFGNHLTGQMTVSFFSPLDTDLPVVGSTFVLIKNEGLSTELSQFLRVTSVSSVEHDFEDGQGIFRRQIITVGVSDTLRYDFVGFDATRYPPSQTDLTTKTRVRTTVVANAARYYGVRPLASSAAVGDYSVEAGSIFTQLVPSAQIETPITDARMNQQSAALSAAGSNVTITPTLVFDTTHSLYVGGCILPGSLTLTRDGVTLTDGGGVLLRASDGAQVGTIDYANGVLSLTLAVFGSSGGSHSVTFTPAYAPKLVSKGLAMPVTAVSQRLTWSVTLDSLPTRRSLSVSYRAQGRWYSLYEDGSGAIRGSDSSFGIGSINFLTGTVSLTLGALPDVGTKVILNWAPSQNALKLSAMPVSYADESLLNRLYAKIEVGAPIKPGTLTLTWSSSGAKTASDSNGALIGDAVGRVIYGTGTILFSPNVLPNAGTDIQLDLTPTVQVTKSITSYTELGGDYQLTLDEVPVKPKTVHMSVRVRKPTDAAGNRGELNLAVTDDGSGNLIVSDNAGMKIVGSINYATGAVVIAGSVSSFRTTMPQYVKHTYEYPSAFASA